MTLKACQKGYDRSQEYSLIEDAPIRTKGSPIKAKTVCLSISLGVVCASVLLGCFLWYVAPLFQRIRQGTLWSNEAEGNSLGWTNTYRGMGYEGCVRLVDIDEDGILDIIYGIGRSVKLSKVISQPLYCKNYTKGCVGAIIGARGIDGAEMWNIPTKHEVFELNCGNLDLNKDGKLDCVGSGREATILAFDPRTGKHLWKPQTGHEPYLDFDWNIYNPLALPDVDGDGIGDVLLPHGGDPLFPPENHTRYPARFIVVSGANGAMINHYFEPSDGKETYHSPVLHTFRNGSQHFLIGTGGETVNGTLYAVPLDSLPCLTKGTDKCSLLNRTDVFDYAGVRNLYKSATKGIMVPPVIVDLNGDGEDDIVVLAFDGTVVVIDGGTYNILWKRELKGFETYSTPAVGYFNDDDQPDVLTMWSFGDWPNYSHCMIIVFDGKTGDTLWSFNTSRNSYISTLVVRTNDKFRDAFVLGIQGRSGVALDDDIGVVHGIDPQRQLIKAPISEQPKTTPSITCDTPDLSALATEIILVDSTTLGAPLLVYKKDVDKFYYDEHSSAGSDTNEGSHALENGRTSCAIMQQQSLGTGAIGDVDGDGYLDLVMTFMSTGVLMKEEELLRTELRLDVAKISFEKNIKKFPRVAIETSSKVTLTSKNELKETRFLPASQQPWMAYMGTRGDGAYGRSPLLQG